MNDNAPRRLPAGGIVVFPFATFRATRLPAGEEGAV